MDLTVARYSLLNKCFRYIFIPIFVINQIELDASINKNGGDAISICVQRISGEIHMYTTGRNMSNPHHSFT